MKEKVHLILDKRRVILKEANEKNKFKNIRRKKIYNSITLSREQEKKIDNIYINNYGDKIPYIWHKYYTAYTGNFDEYYFPELLYIPRFEYYMNYNKAYCSVFEDKSILPLLASNLGIKTPKAIITCSYGLFRNSKNEWISKEKALSILYNIGNCFAKPTVDSDSGKGCILLNLIEGYDTKSDLKIEKIIDNLGDNFVIQEIIKCHKTISDIYPNSVNTFRIITYRWKNEILFTPSIMRIGRGGNYLDNAHAGGIFIAIDDDGQLHKTAFTEFCDKYDVHPDTNIIFEKCKIDLFPKVLETAKRMHTLMPQVGVVNWDFTIDDNGEPILIEGNLLGGGIWVIQIAHGKGPFENKTIEILNWLKIMKKVKPEDRDKYKFGNIPYENIDKIEEELK